MTSAGVKLGGLVPFSSVDFPSKLAAVLFTRGCPLRCSYCHNPHLQARAPALTAVNWDEIMAWLRRRRNLLDAVVFSGGEPTMHAGLAAAMAEVRELGFAVGLHTAGTNARRISQIIDSADWIGLDVKAPFRKYRIITRSDSSGAHARRSLDTILAHGKNYEVRTTYRQDLLTDDDMMEIATELRVRGVSQWTLQAFRPVSHGDPKMPGLRSSEPNDALVRTLRDLIPDLQLRL